MRNILQQTWISCLGFSVAVRDFGNRFHIYILIASQCTRLSKEEPDKFNNTTSDKTHSNLNGDEGKKTKRNEKKKDEQPRDVVSKARLQRCKAHVSSLHSENNLQLITEMNYLNIFEAKKKKNQKPNTCFWAYVEK